MLRTLFTLTLLSFVCGTRAPRTPQTYYLSADGNDNAMGTSPQSAWRHLARLNEAVGVLQPGDGVRLRRGDVWVDEQLRLPLLSGGGTLTSYGNASLPRPWISQSVHASRDEVSCVELLAPQNASVSQLRLSGCARGVQVLVPDRGAGALTIEQCFFSDIRTAFGNYHPADSNWGLAVEVVGAGQMTGLVVRNNVGIRLDSFFNTRAFLNGLLLDSNTVAQCQGNCVGMVSGTDMTLSNSVFLRDFGSRLFMYGTTDVIIGTVAGSNAIIDTDFHARGEFEGGPDGCAVDFETSASGFRVSGNTFYKSWGAGVMIFGHDTTSHGFDISRNTFVAPGCVQPRNDRGGISFMCPGGHKPSGTASNNTFVTCAGVPAMFDNPNVPDCSVNVSKEGNRVEPVSSGSAVEEGVLVAVPQLSFSPPAPTSTAPSVTVPLLATTPTINATIRYTTDGSRPTVLSPELPIDGLQMQWPGPNIAINVRAFAPPGSPLLPSVTNGVVIERATYEPRSHPPLNSQLEHVGDGKVQGWVCDWAVQGGLPPSTVEIFVDYASEPVLTLMANKSRPDLVTAKVCTSAAHGFTGSLPAAVAARFSEGKHVVDAYIAVDPNGGPLSRPRTRLESSPQCVCNAAPCSC